jgi:uncharacterized protein (TIGR02145 family)
MSLPAPIIKNEYGLDWVLLDNKWWAISNYKGTKLADGTAIPIVTDAATWAALETLGMCYYNNTADEGFKNIYGGLYNAYAVIAGLEMPCPGCRVPSKTDWTSLVTFLIANGYNWDGTITGNKIGKALASNGGEWQSNATTGNVGNDQANNNTSGLGFLPGGYRSNNGTFFNAGTEVRFHASGDILVDNGLFRNVTSANSDLLESTYSQPFHLRFGSYIRIVRDYVPRRRIVVVSGLITGTSVSL